MLHVRAVKIFQFWPIKVIRKFTFLRFLICLASKCLKLFRFIDENPMKIVSNSKKSQKRQETKKSIKNWEEAETNECSYFVQMQTSKAPDSSGCAMNTIINSSVVTYHSSDVTSKWKSINKMEIYKYIYFIFNKSIYTPFHLQ